MGTWSMEWKEVLRNMGRSPLIPRMVCSISGGQNMYMSVVMRARKFVNHRLYWWGGQTRPLAVEHGDMPDTASALIC